MRASDSLGRRSTLISQREYFTRSKWLKRARQSSAGGRVRLAVTTCTGKIQ